MHMPVAITINGRVFQRDVEPRLLLVHFLRDIAGLTGTKVGCDTSQCGACTVLVDGLATKSCTRLAVQADGLDHHDDRRARAGRRAASPSRSRSGPNMGCSAASARPGHDPDGGGDAQGHAAPDRRGQVRHGLEGNLCRCTGYQNIVRVGLRRRMRVGGRA